MTHQVDEPDSANERERKREEDDERLTHSLEGEVQEQEDYADGQRHDHGQPLGSTLGIFELT